MAVSTTSRLGAVAISLVLISASLAGCTSAQVTAVVKDIAVYAQDAEPVIAALLPILEAANTSTNDPAVQAINAYGAQATADLNSLIALCNDYTETPSTSIYTQIVAAVDTLVSQGDAALLQVAAIKSTATQESAQVALGSFDALLHTIDGFVQSTESTTNVAATAKARAIKLKQVSSYWSAGDQEGIAHAFHTPYRVLLHKEQSLGY